MDAILDWRQLGVFTCPLRWPRRISRTPGSCRGWSRTRTWPLWSRSCVRLTQARRLLREYSAGAWPSCLRNGLYLTRSSGHPRSFGKMLQWLPGNERKTRLHWMLQELSCNILVIRKRPSSTYCSELHVLCCRSLLSGLISSRAWSKAPGSAAMPTADPKLGPFLALAEALMLRQIES